MGSYVTEVGKQMSGRNTVSVLGSGVMGIDLAILCGLAGYQVAIWHRTDSGTASKRFHRRGKSYLDRAILSEVQIDALRASVSFTDSLEEAAESRVIVEAIIEDLDAKQALFSYLDDFVDYNTLIATNTSTLSLRDLILGYRHSDQMIGLHFFNPVLKMKLVEVVHTDETDSSILSGALEFVESLGKEPVTLRDSPGFIVNRLLMQYINSAAALLEAGICSAADLDKAMKLGANHPIGPLALADLIGVDVVVASLDNLHKKLQDDSYRPCTCLRRMLQEGRLGRKAGIGFYEYSD